jgi:hypothetical protein
MNLLVLTVTTLVFCWFIMVLFRNIIGTLRRALSAVGGRSIGDND